MESLTDNPARAIIFAALDPAIRNGLAEHRTEIILRRLADAGFVIVPKEVNGALSELARVTDLLETWAADHSQERTAEIDAAIHCARAVLSLQPQT